MVGRSIRGASLSCTLLVACTQRELDDGAQASNSGAGSSSDASADATADAGASANMDASTSAAAGDDTSDGGSAEPCADMPDGMACVPAGPFVRGCDGDTCVPPNWPAREVTLSTFAIDRREVIQLDYAACAAEGACPPAADVDLCANGKDSVQDDLPVDCVPWEAARAYCEFVGKRLPTEAEWEKAARGDDARPYPWGEDPATCDRAVMWDEPYGNDDWGCWVGHTWAPGSKPLGDSPYGLHDMAGNAREWVADWWSAEDLAEFDGPDPVGPASGSQRVMKGGRDISTDDELFAYQRESEPPDFAGPSTGFRCAVSLPD